MARERRAMLVGGMLEVFQAEGQADETQVCVVPPRRAVVARRPFFSTPYYRKIYETACYTTSAIPAVRWSTMVTANVNAYPFSQA